MRKTKTTLRLQVQAAISAGYLQVFQAGEWRALTAFLSDPTADLELIDPPACGIGGIGLGRVVVGREVVAAKSGGKV